MAPRHVLSFLLLTALALTAQPVQAGDEAAPEIVDAEGDAAVCIQSPACLPNQGALDVVRGWIDIPDAASIGLHLVVFETPPVPGVAVGAALPDDAPEVGGLCLSNGFSLQYEFHFRPMTADGTALLATDATGNEITDLYVRAALPCDSTAAGAEALSWTFALIYQYAAVAGSTIVDFPVTGSVSGNVFSWQVNRSLEPVGLPLGDAAAGLQIGNLALQSSVVPRAAHGSVTLGVDNGPDEGFGTPFAFPKNAPPAPTTTYQDATAPSFTLAASEPAAVSKTTVYNWTAGASAFDLAYKVAPTAGSVHVVVVDSAAKTIFDSTFVAADEGTLAIPQTAAGLWQVRVAYDGFAGDLQLGIAPAAAPEPVAAPPAAEEPVIDPVANDQQTGGFPMQQEKDAAGAGPLLALLAIAAGALGIRRRMP